MLSEQNRSFRALVVFGMGMFKKVSVLVPTRGRVERLRTMIASFDETTGNQLNAELVFRIDEDDIWTREFLLAWGGHKIVVGKRGAGYTDMSRYCNEAASAAQGDVLMIGNDDMVFKTSGWADLVLEEANKHPDGLFDIGISTHNEDHYPFAIVSKRVVDILGFIWDPRIYWGDVYLRDVMGMFGRAMKLPGVVIDHDWAGFRPDVTFIEGEQNNIYEREPDYWNKIHAPLVAEAVEKLRSLEGVVA